MNHSAMIAARFLSNSSFKFSSYSNAIAFLHYHSFLANARFSHQIRHFSFKPRFDFGCIRKPDDATALFEQMMRTEQPPASVFDFNKLLSAVVKMRQFYLALHLFGQMRLRNAPVDHCTLNIVIDFFCRWREPDFGLSILGSFFKLGYEPDVVTFTTLIKGLMLQGRIADADKLLNKLMDERLCQLNEITYLAMIDGYCKAGKPLAALHLLKMFKERSCKLNIRAYNAVIYGLCKEQMVDDALQLFSSLADEDTSPDVHTYSSMIKGLCGSSRWDEAEELLKKMVADEVYPNVVTFSILIDAFCKEGRLEAARHIFQTVMPQVNVRPDAVTYAILIGALCERGQIEEAKDLLMQMLNNGCVPTKETYNVVVQRLLERKEIEEAMRLLERMTSRGLELGERFDSGCLRKLDVATAVFVRMMRVKPRPSAIEFSKLLSAVVKRKQYSVALHLFEQMLERGVPVDHYTMSIAVDCFCRLKRPDFGLSILGSFFKRGHEPDVVTFNTLIKGLLAVGRINDAAKLLYKLTDEQHWQPNAYSYHAIIDGYCKAGKPLAALHLLRVFEERSCKQNVYVYTVVIDGLCKEQMVDDALQLFSSLADKGISPDVHTYSSMIQGLCGSSRWDEAEELLKKMVADEVYPNVVTFSILMDAFCKEGKLEAAQHILQTVMPQVNVRPDIVNYNILLNGLCSAHRIAEAFSVLHSTEDDDEGIIPNIVTYNTLISGLCNDDKVDIAQELFNEIPSKGMQPTVVTYNILIGALCKQGQMEEAKDLLMQMVNNGCLPNRVTYSVVVQCLLERNKIEEAMVLLEEMNSKGFKLDETTSSRMIEATSLKMTEPGQKEGKQRSRNKNEESFTAFGRDEFTRNQT